MSISKSTWIWTSDNRLRRIFNCSDYCIKIKSTISVWRNNALGIWITVHVCGSSFCLLFPIWFDFLGGICTFLRYCNRYSNEYMRLHWKGYKYKTIAWVSEWINEWRSVESQESALYMRAASAAATTTPFWQTKPHTCDSVDTRHMYVHRRRKLNGINMNLSKQNDGTQGKCDREVAKAVALNHSRHIASNIDIWFSHFLMFFASFFQLFHPSVSIDFFISFPFICNAFSQQHDSVLFVPNTCPTHHINMFHCVQNPILLLWFFIFVFSTNFVAIAVALYHLVCSILFIFLFSISALINHDSYHLFWICNTRVKFIKTYANYLAIRKTNALPLSLCNQCTDYPQY